MQRNEPFQIYIGYDSTEPIAYHVLVSSILRHASIPVSIIPLARQALGRLYTRPRASNEATEFSLTRFLVPYLSHYEGYSLFMDCDMLMQVDILDLWLELLAYPGKSVWCCKHDYVPKALTKFDGHEQTKYPRKNWSSFMVFDNSKCANLTPGYVNTASGLELHRLHWLESDAEIGALPLDWNWLVGEYAPNRYAKVLHYTNGTPCFDDYATCDQSDVWWDEYRRATSPQLLSALRF